MVKPVANYGRYQVGLFNNAGSRPVEVPGKWTNISERECSKKFVQPSPDPVEGKAAAVLTRGAYSQYVSARGATRQVCEPEGQAKGRPCQCEARERCWRLFSTFLRFKFDESERCELV